MKKIRKNPFRWEHRMEKICYLMMIVSFFVAMSHARASTDYDPYYFAPDRVTVHHTEGMKNDSIDQAIHAMSPRHAEMVRKGWMEQSETGLPVAYHYVVDRAGDYQMTRGLDEMGSHQGGYNHHSYGIAMIGTMHNYGPSREQYMTVAKLIVELEEYTYSPGRNKLVAVGHHEQVPTINETDGTHAGCPGRMTDMDLIRQLADMMRRQKYDAPRVWLLGPTPITDDER